MKSAIAKRTLAYAKEFLVPVNARYEKEHPTIAPGWNVAKLLVQMMLNGSLHGFTPSGIYDDASQSCIAWAVGPVLEDRTHHLHFGGGYLWIDGGLLLDELIASMQRFATQLDENKPDANGVLPRHKFREGFRWRFFPALVNDKAPPPSWNF